MKLSLKMWKAPVYQLEYMREREQLREDIDSLRKDFVAFKKDFEDLRKDFEDLRKDLEKFKKTCVTAFLEASS